MSTARDVYENQIRGLPPAERLQVAAMILNELAGLRTDSGFSDEWTEEDMRDATEACLLRAFAE